MALADSAMPIVSVVRILGVATEWDEAEQKLVKARVTARASKSKFLRKQHFQVNDPTMNQKIYMHFVQVELAEVPGPRQLALEVVAVEAR